MGGSDDRNRNDDIPEIPLSSGDLEYYESMTDEQRQRIPAWLRSKADAMLDKMRDASASRRRELANLLSALSTADVDFPKPRIAGLVEELGKASADLPKPGVGGLVEKLRGIDPSSIGLGISKETAEKARYIYEHATECEKTLRKRHFNEWCDEANGRIAQRTQDFRQNAESDLTQEQAAALFGMSTPTLSSIETGKRPVKAGELVVMSSYYGIRPELLVSPLEGDDLTQEAELLSVFDKMTFEDRQTIIDFMNLSIKRSNS